LQVIFIPDAPRHRFQTSTISNLFLFLVGPLGEVDTWADNQGVDLGRLLCVALFAVRREIEGAPKLLSLDVVPKRGLVFGGKVAEVSSLARNADLGNPFV